MKYIKLIAVLTAFVMFWANVNTVNAEVIYKKFSKQLKGKAQTKRLPEGTRMKLRLIDPISTKESSEGDFFNAVLVEDQKLDGILLLPQGSAVRGSVKKIIPQKSFSRGAIVYIDIDHVVTPTGKQLSMETGVCGTENITIDGGFQDGKGYGDASKQNLQNAKVIIKKSAQWGANTGNKAFEGGGYVLAPFTAIGGVLGAGGYLIGDQIVDIFKKGKNITINQDSIIDVMLIKPLDVPIN